MKPTTKQIFPLRSRRAHAFTLVELLITMVTVVIVVGAVLSSSMYGMRMLQIVKPKLGASDEARRAISLLTDEIREARNIKLGSGTVSTFTEVAPFSQQVGNAIQIYPTGATNRFIRYFWDAVDMKLKRTTNGTTATYVVANCVSNANSEFVFKCQDAFGNTLSNNYNNRVIALTLQFYQIEYPVMPVGPGNYYDFYQLRAKITRRTLF